MQDREPLLVCPLADGTRHKAVICASAGRALELELLEPAADCGVGKAAELEGREAIYLGMIDRRQGDRVWITVEHLLDRGSLEGLRSLWRESSPRVDTD